MKKIVMALSVLCCFAACKEGNKTEQQPSGKLEGTWQLITGTLIENGDTTRTNYTGDPQMIKVINSSHFAFLNHDLKKGKDSTAVFVAGGGRYELNGDQYTEHLEYCSDRVWEGNDFSFTVEVQHDTLTQKGIEKVEGTKVNRLNIEKYVRIKPEVRESRF